MSHRSMQEPLRCFNSWSAMRGSLSKIAYDVGPRKYFLTSGETSEAPANPSLSRSTALPMACVFVVKEDEGREK